MTRFLEMSDYFDQKKKLVSNECNFKKFDDLFGYLLFFPLVRKRNKFIALRKKPFLKSDFTISVEPKEIDNTMQLEVSWTSSEKKKKEKIVWTIC